MDISEKIRILIIKRKTNQTELAKKLGMSNQNLNNKLRQERFSRKELEAIGEALSAVYNEDPPPRQWFILNDTGEEV